MEENGVYVGRGRTRLGRWVNGRIKEKVLSVRASIIPYIAVPTPVALLWIPSWPSLLHIQTIFAAHSVLCYPEGVSRKFLWNVGSSLPDCTAPHTTRLCVNF
jgi:hypothetical protein